MSGLEIVGLLIVLFIAWHFIPQPSPRGPEPKFRRDPRVTAENPKWQGFIEQHCESPAEIAFLRAIIDAYELTPDKGSLRGIDLKIDLQVEEGPYRVDFLANEWLVIEIDGAAYHSSAEAKKRDAVRDLFFEGLGYSVLRIPAKTVFNMPDEVVRRVNSALAIGKRETPEPTPLSGFERLSKTVISLGDGIEHVHNHVSQMRAIDNSLKNARTAKSREQEIIETAIEIAEMNLEEEDYLESLSTEKQDYYLLVQDQLREKLRSERSNNLVKSISIPEFCPPIDHKNPEIDKRIKEQFSALSVEREEFFKRSQNKIRLNPRMGKHVKHTLSKWRCLQVWKRIC